jgi:hypothetical protein
LWITRPIMFFFIFIFSISFKTLTLNIWRGIKTRPTKFKQTL